MYEYVSLKMLSTPNKKVNLIVDLFVWCVGYPDLKIIGTYVVLLQQLFNPGFRIEDSAADRGVRNDPAVPVLL